MIKPQLNGHPAKVGPWSPSSESQTIKKRSPAVMADILNLDFIKYSLRVLSVRGTF